jgi:sialic acid synthase SpsE
MNKNLLRDKQIFENLFVLELANNHWGSLERGLKIINDHARVVRHNGIKAAIKLQFRDVDEFIHEDYKGNKDLRYINKTEVTKLTEKDFKTMLDEIKNLGCIPMATPFDEKSVDLCVKFDLPIIKIASSDMNDWPLIEKIASTRKPTIVSTGGASEKDLDDLVKFFDNRDIPLAINHCVSLYPSEDEDLELHQIDYLKNRFPNHVIGFSTHEYNDWSNSMLISYAKGARSWERHIDIDYEDIEVSKYCSLPENCDEWFRAFKKAQEMSGSSSDQRRLISKKESVYLNNLVRGIYAKKDIDQGYVFSQESFDEDFYLAIPLHKGQLSCREVMNGEKIIKPIKKNEMLLIDNVDGPYADNKALRKTILNRGID